MKSDRISRRSFLARTASVTAAVATSPFWQPLRPIFADHSHPGNPVQFPPEWSGGNLTAAPAEIEVWPGQNVPMLAINGTVPAPTIRVSRWHSFAAQINNELDDHLVLHWHGILAPAEMDGHPGDAVGPGQSYSVDFPIRQQAGTYWYHAHTHGMTGMQLYLGLAGFFIVEDPRERHLRLPSGDHDLPLLIQDKRTHGEMHFAYDPESADFMTGFLGDAVFVNNTPEPYLSVDQSLYRLRLVNGANARVFRLSFLDERPFYLIANDGGLLQEPIAATNTLLAPGQRAEILVDFSEREIGEAVTLTSLPFGGGHGGGDDGDGTHIPPQGAAMTVMTFYVDHSGAGSEGVPPRLTHFRPIEAAHARLTRVFDIDTDWTTHFINGALYDMDRVDVTVPFGDLEVWEYRNHTNEIHPMHPHGTLFQVLERPGFDVLPPEDTGWKDTVMVRPGETVRVLVRYDSYAGEFVHHCHNLEHGDRGMMQNVEIISRRG